MQNYNPLAPFSKGDFVQVPLRKGEFLGGYAIKSIYMNHYSKQICH